jgi:hypothetical protein
MRPKTQKLPAKRNPVAKHAYLQRGATHPDKKNDYKRMAKFAITHAAMTHGDD